MIKDSTKIKIPLYFAMVFSFISSFSVYFIRFIEIKEYEQLLKLLIPIVFWVFLVLEQIMIIISSKKKKKINNNRNKSGKIGIIKFFSNKFATVFDVVFILSIMLVAMSLLFNFVENNKQYFIFFILVFSFRLHCILNGKNFNYR